MTGFRSFWRLSWTATRTPRARAASRWWLLVDLAVVEGPGRDEVVEVAGRLPQLAVALAHGGAGDPVQLLGQGHAGVAFTRAAGDGWGLDRTGRSLALAGLEPLE
jgi:hypothetical protein